MAYRSEAQRRAMFASMGGGKGATRTRGASRQRPSLWQRAKLRLQGLHRVAPQHRAAVMEGRRVASRSLMAGNVAGLAAGGAVLAGAHLLSGGKLDILHPGVFAGATGASIGASVLTGRAVINRQTRPGSIQRHAAAAQAYGVFGMGHAHALKRKAYLKKYR